MSETTSPNGSNAEFQHILESARKCIQVDELEAAEEQLQRARSLEPAEAPLYDVWADLELARGRFDEAARRMTQAWELEPTPQRGLRLARERSATVRLLFLRELNHQFPASVEVVVSLAREELAPGGFEAGDAASKALVNLCPGGSVELMAAMGQTLEGLAIDPEALAVFQPLVSAEITRRSALEQSEPEQREDLEATLDLEAAPPPAQAATPPPAPQAARPPTPPRPVEAEKAPPKPVAPSTATEERLRKAREYRERMESELRGGEPTERELAFERWGPFLCFPLPVILAVWTAFLGGHDWMLVTEMDILLLHITIPSASALTGIVIARLAGKTAGLLTFITTPVVSMMLAVVTLVLYHWLGPALELGLAQDQALLALTTGTGWAAGAFVGFKVALRER